MKRAIYSITYLAGLVIGLLFLIFSRDPLLYSGDAVSPVIKGLVIAGGITFCFAGIATLLMSLKIKKDANGVIENRPWYITAMGIASTFWGILTLCMAPVFAHNLAVTLGVSLVLAGLTQTMWTVDASRPYGAAGWWYVVAAAVFGGGIVDITLINDYSNFAQSSSTAAIVSGILLLCFGIVGLLSAGRRKRVETEVIESVNRISGKDPEK